MSVQVSLTFESSATVLTFYIKTFIMDFNMSTFALRSTTNRLFCSHHLRLGCFSCAMNKHSFFTSSSLAPLLTQTLLRSWRGLLPSSTDRSVKEGGMPLLAPEQALEALSIGEMASARIDIQLSTNHLLAPLHSSDRRQNLKDNCFWTPVWSDWFMSLYI